MASSTRLNGISRRALAAAVSTGMGYLKSIEGVQTMLCRGFASRQTPGDGRWPCGEKDSFAYLPGELRCRHANPASPFLPTIACCQHCGTGVAVARSRGERHLPLARY